MIQIISGTNRKGSNSLKVAGYVAMVYAELKQETQVIDLAKVPMPEGVDHDYTSKNPFTTYVEKVNSAEGLVLVCPEYNGSYPGVLKYFIDHWSYPKSFESRPVSFIGLGGRFGGLRPVEHLQQVFGYRNAFVFPQRVFIMNVGDVIKAGNLESSVFAPMIRQQCEGFIKFISALRSSGLGAR